MIKYVLASYSYVATVTMKKLRINHAFWYMYICTQQFVMQYVAIQFPQVCTCACPYANYVMQIESNFYTAHCFKCVLDVFTCWLITLASMDPLNKVHQ